MLTMLCNLMLSSVAMESVSLTVDSDAVLRRKALFNLAQMQLKGLGCEQDYKEARKKFEEVIGEDDELSAWSRAYLAYLYHDGLGSEKDEEQAMLCVKGVNWYVKAITLLPLFDHS